jgi:hypothetical protein
MADYYSVISRAVAALEINTFEDRRATAFFTEDYWR